MKNEDYPRIKRNQLLAETGWVFFDNEICKASVLPEGKIKITQKEVDAWGNDFDKLISIYFMQEGASVLMYFLNACIIDGYIWRIIVAKYFHTLQTHSKLSISKFEILASKYRDVILAYVDDYVKPNKFAA